MFETSSKPNKQDPDIPKAKKGKRHNLSDSSHVVDGGVTLDSPFFTPPWFRFGTDDLSSPTENA